MYFDIGEYNTDMNDREKTPAHDPGDTVVAKTLAELMLADPDINGSPTKLANAINETVLKDSEKKANQPTIARILNGEIEDPKHPVLWPIAEYFGVSTELFYKGKIEAMEMAAAIISSETKRLTRFFLEADTRGRDTILSLAKIEASRADPLAEIPEGPDTGKMERRVNPKDPGPKTYSQKKKPKKKK